jgi:hypothetical protein
MVINEVKANPPFPEPNQLLAPPEHPSMPSPFPGMNPYLEQEDAWHDDAGYADYIYDGAPRPRLGDENADWARQFLPQPSS